MTANACELAAIDENICACAADEVRASAATAWACIASNWKALAFLASTSNAFGFAAMIAIAWLFWARAAKPGSEASARKLGLWAITSNASVCMSCGMDVSPSVTSAAPTCGAI